MKHIITSVDEGGILEQMGVEPGDALVSVNGKRVADVFDYRFLTTEEYLEVLIEKQNGEEWLLEIEKEEYEDLGASFREPMMAKANSCSNNCIFCFIDQLPAGMRAPLYFKDDDSRLSFLTGNYVTLTNISDKEFDRLLGYRLSPINVSVHTLNPELRVKMLGNKKAANITERLKRISDAGIEINCQIVLVKGVNDGAELESTICGLRELEGVRSVSVVPVGLTKHRQKLAALLPFGMDDAQSVLELIHAEQRSALKAKGTRFVYAADEFYLKANMPFPGYSDYDGFPQLENGVGMAALFEKEFDHALIKLRGDAVCRHVSVITGRSAKGIIEKLVAKTSEKFTKTEIEVIMVENSFFGDEITVSGLLTGQDIVGALEKRNVKGRVLLPSNCLKAETDLFLDGLSVQDINERLEVDAISVTVNGERFIHALIDTEEAH